MRLATVATVLAVAVASLHGQARRDADFERLPFDPVRTVCYRTATPLTIDGRLDEPAWRAAAWSEHFVDIDGVRRPHLATRVKMLWDDDRFYIAAELEEPDIWATLTQRDSVIFHDKRFRGVHRS